MKYGKTLKLIRDKKAYTLDHVADEIGISTDKLTHIENQPEAPDTETLTKLADFIKSLYILLSIFPLTIISTVIKMSKEGKN